MNSVRPEFKIKPKNNMLTDSELYQKCREAGGLCRKYRNQFLGMLPEVMRRKLYLKHGMISIYEFAAKLACIPRETVNEVLRIHQHLETAPLLQEKLVSGEIGYTKLRAVATIVRPETQQLWLEKVESMSKPTLEVYVRELKRQENGGYRRGTGIETEIGIGTCTGHLGKEKIPYENPDRQAASAPGASSAPEDQIGRLPGKEYDFISFAVKVRSQTLAKMRVMKQRLEKKLKKPINWDEAFEEMLKIVDEAKPKRRRVAVHTGARKREPADKQKTVVPDSTEKQYTVTHNAAVATRRYIPAQIRHKVEAKNQGICYFPDCAKPGQIFHHLNRFALNPRHESRTIAYLCKPHEQIAHQSLIKKETDKPANWHVSITPDTDNPANKAKYFIDRLVRKYRRAA